MRVNHVVFLRQAYHASTALFLVAVLEAKLRYIRLYCV